MKGIEFLLGVDGEYWKKVVYELLQENKDVYSKVFDKKVKEYLK